VALSPIKRIDTFLIERFSNSSPVQFGWALFFLGCLVRIGLVFATHYYRYTLPPDTEDEWLRVAANLAAGRGFVNPYCCESGPTGHVSPGFAYLLAAEYLLVRGPMRAIVISVVSCIVSSAVYAMTPWLAESLGFSRLTGRWAGLAGAAVPLFFWIEVCGVLEAPYIALALVIGVALTLGAKSLRGLALSGAAWGAGFWFAPNALPVMLGCAAVAISRLPRRAALPGAVLLITPAAAIISPWIVRDYVVLHGLFWVRDNMGLELRVSNNSEAVAFALVNIDGSFYRRYHPNVSPVACAQVQRLGEAAVYRQYRKDAIEWIAAHPGPFARLTAQRVLLFWFPPWNSRLRQAMLCGITLLAFLGILMNARRSRGAMLGAILLLYSGVYYLVQADPRYRYPLQPFVLIAAAAAALGIVSKMSGRRFA